MGSCGDRSEAGREGDSELEMVANFKVEPMKQIANIAIGILCLLGLCGTSLVAQNVAQNQAPSAPQSTTSGTSLGEYARQVRKDSGPSAKPRVFDNDNLPKEDQLSIVGTPTPSDSTAENKSDGSANRQPRRRSRPQRKLQAMLRRLKANPGTRAATRTATATPKLPLTKIKTKTNRLPGSNGERKSPASSSRLIYWAESLMYCSASTSSA